ncbi:hypothetical protein AAFO92_19310 [Roseovarius sp. CAU 1744]
MKALLGRPSGINVSKYERILSRYLVGAVAQDELGNGVTSVTSNSSQAG